VQYLLDTSTYTGNDPGKNLVTVYPTPPLSSAHTWQALGVPYVITEQLQVEGAAGHLTLQPGVRMEFAAEGGLRVAGARLTAVGTADKHIVFTREPDAGANWRGLHFHDSDSVDNRLEYVDISYGGSTAYNDAAAPALLSLTTESTGGSSGVWLSNVTLSSTSAHGIWVDTRSGVRSCTSVTFTDVGTHSNTGSCQ
jgi:hypothetical protein